MSERHTHIVKRASGYVAGWFVGEPPAEFVAECNANVPADPAHVEALDWDAWDAFCDEVLGEPDPELGIDEAAFVQWAVAL